MSIDLILKPSCGGCGSTDELYGSTCKHLTLCVNCGKSMAEKRLKCYECGTPITRLIREYNVRASSSNDKNYFIARFASGLPSFKKKNENKWSLQKEGLQGRQVTDTLREKFKNKPWLLEDETGQFQYHGHLEGTQTATYYLLMLQGKEFVAIPAGSWYNFTKVAQYKQLTLEEAEEKMKNRRRTADGYERWMMKAAHNGAAAFGEVEKFDDREVAGGGGGGKGRKKATGDDDEANVSDRGDEDEEEEVARKNRLGLNKKSGDDDEEGPRGGDLDFDDDDIEKGDDWEHEEIFTDDDEAVGIDPEEREDLAPEIPAPPEIKQDDEDEDEADEEEGEGGLSKSGKELKKLLGRANGLDDSDAEDDDDDDDTEDDISPVLAPKKEAPKEEPVDNSSPLKATTSATGRGTPSTSKSSKGKRKSSGDETKTPNGAPLKKMKTENELKPVKDENASSSKNIAPPKGATPPTSSKSVPSSPTVPVTEDEIRAVLLRNTSLTIQDLVAKFKSRLKSKEDKNAFADILKRISKIQKTNGAANFVVLRDR
ncbi:transcription initiation factor IIF subunit alpha-like [Salvia miltiorrhiza]|uniref:transcription initiation factor IIF subunit alpha-like n=1 Tax=Salvia miltiorrhiza TaxID=226208 RepID=UPI0025AB7BFB|nr:transcription initiation factor IIF subunit alpha-like [Salvia miltiorrhiza]XP_057764989.1 transcription initiation factor IIF subunit alpha-like [Salvia miltiorrhiza]XP_057764990.1 transcription initiation factor IIF subunit alpha-like [Salvia miltiorrhiza]